MEIIKQLFDIASLAGFVVDFGNTVGTFNRAVADEIAYRDLNITREVVLCDAIESAACIIGKGYYKAEDFPLLLKGIQRIGTHILMPHYHLAVAAEQACKLMYTAACILTGEPFVHITDPAAYLMRDVGQTKYRRLSYMKRQNPTAYAYLSEAVRMLES